MIRIQKSDIQKFIPHREPFIMIDNLISAMDDRYESDFVIDPTNLFLKGDKLSSYGLIENIAQTSAAGIAITAKDPDKKPMDGYLASITKFMSYKSPEVKEQIKTIVIKTMEFQNMYSFHGKCFSNDNLLLECEIKLVGISK